MPVIVKFDNTTTCPQQAQVIPDATQFNDGVMTAAMVRKLNSGGGNFYQTVEVSGAPQPQQPIMNFISANGLTAVDNPGNFSTDVSINEAFAPTWTGVHTFQDASPIVSLSGLLQTITPGITLKNRTPAAGNNINEQQFSPSLRLEGQGWSSVPNSSGPVAYEMLVRPIAGGEATADLVFYAIAPTGIAPKTEMLHILSVSSDSGLGNPMILEIGSSAQFIIIQNEGADGNISLRSNVTDVVEARGVRFGPVSPVTYANAQITSWENPIGTTLATVSPTGVFQAPQYTVLSPGVLFIGATAGHNLAMSVQIAGMGAANPSIITDSTAVFSASAHMQEWKSAGTLLASMVYGGGGANPQLVSASHALSLFNDNTDGVQMGNNTVAFLVGGTTVFSIDNQSFVKWIAAREQTTVGAAGGAAAPPATPVKYFQFHDSTGTTLLVPAYAAP